MAKTTTRRWAKDPPDGTSYTYWVSDDGFVIETKKRFLPQIGYSLYLPKAIAIEGGYCIRFDTLAQAKSATYLQVDELRCMQRTETDRIKALFKGNA